MTDTHVKFEKLILFFLILFILFLPYSIYLSQTAMHLAMILWLVKIFSLPLKEKIWIKTPIDTPFFFLIICLIVSFLANAVTEGYGAQLRSIRSYRHIFILFLIVNNIRKEKNLQFLVTATCFLTSLHALESCGRFFSHFHQNIYASFGGFTESVLYWHVFTLALVRLGSVAAKRERIFNFCVCSVTFLGIVVNQKIEVWLALLMSMACFVGLKHSKLGKYILGLTFVLIFGGGVFYLFGGERVFLQLEAWRIICEHPLGFVTATKNLLQSLGYQDNIDHFHSDFLQMGVVSGVLGIVSLLWFFYSYLARLMRSLKPNIQDFRNDLLVFGSIMFAGLMVLMWLGGPLELSKNMMCIFYFMGIVLWGILKDTRLRETKTLADLM